MRARFLEACQSFQSAEKACWEILFRELPDAELFSEEKLSAAMDRTLDQLWSLLKTGSVGERLEAARANPPPLPTERECGLMSHLPYFNAGERALELIAAEVERTYPELAAPECKRERDELCAAFSVLVQCQLEAICSRCTLAGQCRYSDFRAVAGLPRAGVAAPEPSAVVQRPKRTRSRKNERPSRRRD